MLPLNYVSLNFELLKCSVGHFATIFYYKISETKFTKFFLENNQNKNSFFVIKEKLFPYYMI